MSIVGITCQRDDGAYLVEWLAHHLAAGFDRMLVLSHDCCDGSDELLQALSADPRIAHLPFEPRGKKSVQWQALKLARHHPWVDAADWVLFFDCDEFICIQEGDLPSLISAFELEQGAFDAIALPWRLFGSAGHQQRDPGITPERFFKTAPEDLHFPLAHLFKTLFRPKAFQALGVHRPRAKPHKPARWLAPNGQPLPDHFASNDTIIGLYCLPTSPRRVCLNHYSLRSAEEFLVKRARGLPNHSDRRIDLTYWAERNWNDTENRDILCMMDNTHKELEKLLALPNVLDLLELCDRWHKNAASEQMTDPSTLRFHFRLGMLTGGNPPSAEAGQAFLQAQHMIAVKRRNSLG